MTYLTAFELVNKVFPSVTGIWVINAKSCLERNSVSFPCKEMTSRGDDFTLVKAALSIKDTGKIGFELPNYMKRLSEMASTKFISKEMQAIRSNPDQTPADVERYNELRAELFNLK